MVRRQGDVLIMEAPKGLKRGAAVPTDNGRVILAYGELSGHAHALDGSKAKLFEVPDTQDRLLVVLKGGASLLHEEHSRIELPAGRYIARRQIEYRPEGIVNVAD